MRPFREDGDRAVAILDDEERAVVARLVADVGLLLGAEPFGMERDVEIPDVFAHLARFEERLAEPDDSAILRLLPNAAPEDREVADEFRRLTEPDLRALKIARLRRIWEDLSGDGDEWAVPLGDALATASALTDVRLVLADRLGVASDDDADLLAHDLALAAESAASLEAGGAPDEWRFDADRLWMGTLYQALGWIQDSLIACISDREDEADE